MQPQITEDQIIDKIHEKWNEFWANNENQDEMWWDTKAEELAMEIAEDILIQYSEDGGPLSEERAGELLMQMSEEYDTAFAEFGDAMADARAERSDPYGYRGLSRSDFM